jgi:hypothetical protein
MAELRWIGNKRSDGLAIVIGIEGMVIMPAGERLPVDKCPCCDKPFGSIKAARLVADIMFPIEETSDAGAH